MEVDYASGEAPLFELLVLSGSENLGSVCARHHHDLGLGVHKSPCVKHV